MKLAQVMVVSVVLGVTAAARADLASPTGPVVLTVVGDIDETNRGPMDPAVDKLMDFHEQDFQSGAQFDLEMLESLGTETRRFMLPDDGEVHELEGPTLAAVLDAVGADAAAITMLAIDGFSVDMDAESLATHDWLIGLRRNGRPLGIGGFGPAWAVFSPQAADGRAVEDEAHQWPYQLFLVRVEE